jgi:hypothetical protein
VLLLLLLLLLQVRDQLQDMSSRHKAKGDAAFERQEVRQMSWHPLVLSGSPASPTGWPHIWIEALHLSLHSCLHPHLTCAPCQPSHIFLTFV